MKDPAYKSPIEINEITDVDLGNNAWYKFISDQELEEIVKITPEKYNIGLWNEYRSRKLKNIKKL